MSDIFASTKRLAIPLLLLILTANSQYINHQQRAELTSKRLLNLDIWAEKPPQIGTTHSGSANSLAQNIDERIFVYQNGKVTPGFDPTIPSQTCQPSPKQIKLFDKSTFSSNPEKKVYQDFSLRLKQQEGSEKFSQFDMKLNVLASNDPMNPEVYPKTLKVIQDKDLRFSVTYNCKKLLQRGEKYYDTIKVIVGESISYDSQQDIVYEYMVVCDEDRLRGFDFNFMALFAIAIGIIILAIKTPPLLIFKDMTEEEQQQTELKLSQAVCFFFMSSSMLLLLYLFLDKIAALFTIMITCSCIGCISIIVEDFLLQGLKPGENHMIRKKIVLPLLGEFSYAGLVGIAVGAILSVTWYFTKFWVLNNILAFFLALTFLKTLKLNTLVPGLVLLGLLFFYDIFWVFLSPYFTGGKSVMVAVATGLDIPIKLVMPHLTNDYPTTGCSLLGLGDILIPGIFIIFMSRFGLEVVNTTAYYHGALLAYTAALFACFASLWIFHAAQPALLYIVPALFIAVFVIGQKRNEWEMLKEGIPKVVGSGYQNQALQEEDPFRSTIKEIEKSRRLGGQ